MIGSHMCCRPVANEEKNVKVSLNRYYTVLCSYREQFINDIFSSGVVKGVSISKSSYLVTKGGNQSEVFMILRIRLNIYGLYQHKSFLCELILHQKCLKVEKC